MTKELVVAKNEVSTWTDEKWAKVREMVFPTCKNQEDVELFMEISKTYGLNPIRKEVWLIPYGGRAQIFVGRDGLLAIAHRSGMFDGMETNFGYDAKGNLQWAEATVYNKAFTHPVKCKVFLSEYTTGQNLWAKKPHIMLQKVAEASALRRAFNVNGVYIPEEFDQVKGDYEPTAPKQSLAELTQEPAKLPKGNFDKLQEAINKADTMDALTEISKKAEARDWTLEESQSIVKLLDVRSKFIAEFKKEGE